LLWVGYLVRLQGYCDIADPEKIGEAFPIGEKPSFDLSDSDSEN
jgi:hypothetical protein